MEEEFRGFSRIGYLQPSTFFEIAIDSFNKYSFLEKEISLLKKNGIIEIEGTTLFKEFESITAKENEILKETIKAVIFLGAFLESYFFDYSAIALGQSYTERFIEKADLTAKIVLIPKLVTGKDLRRDLEYWAGIKDLIKWRNKIVHNKTKDFKEFLKNFSPGNSKALYEEFELRRFFRSVEELFKELDTIDPAGYHSSRLALGKKKK